MTFQEAITANAIFRGKSLPKSSNHDDPQKRVSRMIKRGWVDADGLRLTDPGRKMTAEYAEKEGWGPEAVESLRS